MTLARYSVNHALSLLIAVAVLLKPSTAQEVQIMVSGPWAYVTAPNPSPTPAIVIATAQIPHHGDVQVFSGEDADDFDSLPPTRDIITIAHNQPGKYTLVISGLDKCDPVPNPAPTPAPLAYPLNGVNVDSVLRGPSNGFSILMPKPCYYTSFVESRSRLAVDPNSIKQEDPAYTTWMVLHYKAKAGVIPTASVQEIANSQATFLSIDPPSDPPAISIVMGSDSPNETNSRCDSLSGQSVQLEGALFGAKLHYQFPRLLKYGEQSHDYKQDCIDSFASLTEGQLKKVLHDINIVESFQRDPSRSRARANAAFTELNGLVRALFPKEPGKQPKNVVDELEKAGKLFPPLAGGVSPKNAHDAEFTQTTLYAISMTPGAGDCRGAQLNVNSTIP
ncbi:MAG: hypothetical protein WA738_05535 [Candidatus Angelobacter sp.]